MRPIGPVQTRTAVCIVSAVIIATEIILMRELALRFWEHLAWLVIAVALLGFGVSGTVLVLVRRLFAPRTQPLQQISLLCLALSLPLCPWLGDSIDVGLIEMVWQPLQVLRLGMLETVLMVPFTFGAMFIALALQDAPDKVPGHYGASFIGSAAGGILILPPLFLLPPRALLPGCSLLVLAAALPCSRTGLQTVAWACSTALVSMMFWQLPHTSRISDDKDVVQILAMPGSAVVARQFSPQGLVEIIRAPAYHNAPGLALTNTEPVPDQLLVAIDAQISGSLYQTGSDSDLAFLDNTTQALPYRLSTPVQVLIGDTAGNEEAGLARYHGAGTVTVLTGNRSLAELFSEALAPSAARLFRRPDLSLRSDTLTGYLNRPNSPLSLIILPLTGTDFGGLKAATADSMLTLETLRSCFNHLHESGLLSVTTLAHSPPRESLRLLNMLIDILDESGREPRTHIAAIRNWATLTLVAAKTELDGGQSENIRDFAQRKGFDLVWLPDLQPAEVNRFHILAEPYYYLGASMLLGPDRESFLSSYVYDLRSPDIDRPYFHHFNRRLVPPQLTEQLGNRSRAYAEIGTMLLVATLVLSAVLALVLMLLPLIPAVGLPGTTSVQVSAISFFAAIGFAFMLLEMGLLQRLSVYLSHPVYSASAVLSGFLLFGGVGSGLSSRLKEPLNRPHFGLGMAIIPLGLATLMLSGRLLAATQSLHLALKMVIVIVLIGPLATLMGTMFPVAVKRVGRSLPDLVPWVWSVNGFTSVLATLCAPLMAMRWGFDAVFMTALGCYALAALLSLKLPG